MRRIKNSDDYFSEESLRSDLKKKAVKGGSFIAAGRIASTLITLASVPLLARLLDPEDFGLITMVAVVMNFGRMFVDSGLSMATVQQPQITRQQVTNLFWIVSGLGLAIAVIVAAMSPAIGWFYSEPRLTMITLALSTSMVISGLSIQHQALMRRGLQFDSLAISGVVAAIAGQATGVVWAWQHHGMPDDYWALVLIPIVTGLVRLVLVWWLCPWRPGWPSKRSGTKSLVTFGATLSLFNFINFFTRNADSVLIGWWWGATPLGFYDQAYKLFLAPVQNVLRPLSGVAIPTLSRLTDQKQRVTNAYLSILTILLVFLCPAVAAMAVTAQWWIDFILDEKFAESGPIFRLLCIVGIIQPISNSIGWVFVSQGKPQEMLRYISIVGPLTVLGFAIGLPWGPFGVAAGYAVVIAFFQFPYLLYRLKRSDLVDTERVLGTLAQASPISIAVIAANLVLVAQFESESPGLNVAACVATSAVSWALAVACTRYGRTSVNEVLSLAQGLRKSS